jgi:hypothetical protein
MGIVDWLRGFGERKRVRQAEEESTLSAQDREAIQTMRDARRAGLGSPKHSPYYMDLSREHKKH